ncbi:hypothetical protein F4680DRAFT_448506 [Xylaria scruposa]|nr:hypothetical protein F4680DRAFT_448506 [Xylaria scruposa]
MPGNRDDMASPQTPARGRTVAMEKQCSSDDTATTLPPRGSPVSEDHVPDSEVYASHKIPSVSRHSTGRGQASISTPQLQIPLTPAGPKSISDKSESENDSFNHSRSPIESTEATSSIGQASPLLAINCKHNQAPTPTDLLLDVQDDRAISRSHQFDEDVSKLVEISAELQPPCDDRSLEIAKDSIRGGGIPENIPYRASLDSFPGVKPRSSAVAAHDDDEASSLGSDSDDPDQPALDNDYTLHSRIWKQMVKTPTGQMFLPNGSLDELITRDTVEEGLRQDFACKRHGWDQSRLEKKIRSLAKKICPTEIMINSGESFKPIRQIFAILVLMREASEISRFIKQGLSDDDLPLSITEDEDKKISPKRRRSSRSELSFEKLQHFQRWLPGLKDSFWVMQWRVIAPVLTEGEYNDIQLLPLHEKDILPFVACDTVPTKDVGHGGFGVVYTAHIHEKHHDFKDTALCKRGFAIKQIDHFNRKSFYRERNILKKFKGHNAHSHVVNLLSTFKQGRNLNLIFYRAEGDLRDFWRSKKPKPEVRKETVIWVAKQCAGIANALLRLHSHETFSRPGENEEELEDVLDLTKKVKVTTEPQLIDDIPSLLGEISGTVTTEHDVASSKDDRRMATVQNLHSTDHQPVGSGKIRKYGRHGDIKPENILWYNDQEDGLGVLQFTDFGAAELNSGMSKSKVVSNFAATLAYRAPESDIPGWAIRQSADMWSLGCVYLEFITWLLGGETLLREFCEKRMSWDNAGRVEMDTFFDNDQSKDPNGKVVELKVKSCVTAFFDRLHEHANCTEYIHEFLMLIQDEMLVLESGDTSHSNRIRTDELSRELSSLYKKCSNQETYATKKCSRETVGRGDRVTHMKFSLPKEKTDKISDAGSPSHVISALQKRGVYAFPRDNIHRDSPAQTH